MGRWVEGSTFTSERHPVDTVDVSLRRELHFEWDGAKALSNERKHGVAFSGSDRLP